MAALILQKRELERLIVYVVSALAVVALFAVLFWSSKGFAQAAAAATATTAQPLPVWASLLQQLGPWLIGAVLAAHLAHKLSVVLKADGAKRGGFWGAVEEDAAIVADDVDALATKDGGKVKDLLDPTKRAAAEATLAADGIAAAKAAASTAVDAALKRAL